MEETLDTLGAVITQALAPAVTGHSVAFGQLTLNVDAAHMVKVATFLRDDARCRFTCIIDVTAVDWLAREKRFDVVWHFLSPTKNLRVRVKAEADENTELPSIISVFPGADWFERETGFVEVRWDDEQKRVVYDPVRLAQEFRNFDFLSPWEGTDYVLPGDEKAKEPGQANKLAGEPDKKAAP
jgi:NADH-quinone oxidoreductase subunit C